MTHPRRKDRRDHASSRVRAIQSSREKLQLSCGFAERSAKTRLAGRGTRHKNAVMRFQARAASGELSVMHDNILQSVGRTPLVRLRHVAKGLSMPVYVKVEAANPGGS